MDERERKRMTHLRRIEDQIDFCLGLMKRLSEDLQAQCDQYKDSDYNWEHIPNYTRSETDIVRIRRELSQLGLLLDRWVDENS